MAHSDITREHEQLHQHLSLFLLELRAEIRKGFEHLSVALVGDIKEVLASYKALPSSTDFPFPAATAADKTAALVSQHSKDDFATVPPTLLGTREPMHVKGGKDDGNGIWSSLLSDASAESLRSCKEDSTLLHSLRDIAGCSNRRLEFRPSATITNLDEWRDSVEKHMSVKDSSSRVPAGLSQIMEDIRQRNAQQTANQEQYVYRLVHTKAFIAWSVFVILGNAVWMGFECTVAMDNLSSAGGEGEQGWHEVINIIFTCWFVFELLLKLIAFKKDFFFGPDQLWNMLDMCLVLLSIPELFSSLMNVSFVRTVRLFRLTRCLRLMRLVKFLSSLREILMTVFYTMGSLFWSFVAILLVAYIVALLFMQSIYDALQSGNHSINDDPTADFMTVGGTVLVLFSTITGGQDWYDLVKHFFHIGAYGAVYGLVSWVYFMLFGLVNIVVAVFCAKAADTSQANHDLKLEKAKEDHQKKINDLVRIFRSVDTLGRGFIVEEQFRHFANSLDAQLMLGPHGLQLFALEELWGKMTGYAGGTDGEVDLTAFVMSFMRVSGESVSTDLMLLESKIKRMRNETREQYQQLHDHFTGCCQEMRDQIIQNTQVHGRRKAKKKHVKASSTDKLIE